MSAGAAGGAAAAAAAAKRRREQEEEEELTSYQESDLNDDWEFKIVRSMTSAFKNPDKLRQALAEEAQAGWVLVEKFDNGRLRLKRPASARARQRGAVRSVSRLYRVYRKPIRFCGAGVGVRDHGGDRVGDSGNCHRELASNAAE